MERKWEDLGVDCLINVFGRLETEDLMIGIPFVCKNWYRASLNPQCWKTLDLSILDFDTCSSFASKFNHQYRTQNFSITRLVKFCVNRGGESVIKLLLPSACGLDVLIYASNKCPHMKILGLPSLLVKYTEIIPLPLEKEDWKELFELVPKWKDLKYIHIHKFQTYTAMLLSQISFHCHNFIGLIITGLTRDDEALAIANHLPRLKHLILTSAYMSRENFMLILEGCKELEELTVGYLCGFVFDEEILKMVSHIKKFEYNLSVEEDDW